MKRSIRLSVLIANVALGACVHTPTDVGRQEAMEGIPFRLFPELPTSSWKAPFAGASVPPSADAPPCAAVGAPDAEWRVSRARTSSRWLAAVSVRLPARFTMQEVHDLPEDAEEHGGVLVGSWTDTMHTPGSRDGLGANLAVWVGPEPGYTTVGADTAARQLAVAECTSASPVAGARFVSFTLVGPRGAEHYLAAVWPVAPARYLRVLASAEQPESLKLLHRAVASIDVEPRTP
jgi:hypothetical protein